MLQTTSLEFSQQKGLQFRATKGENIWQTHARQQGQTRSLWQPRRQNESGRKNGQFRAPLTQTPLQFGLFCSYGLRFWLIVDKNTVFSSMSRLFSCCFCFCLAKVSTSFYHAFLLRLFSCTSSQPCFLGRGAVVLLCSIVYCCFSLLLFWGCFMIIGVLCCNYWSVCCI